MQEVISMQWGCIDANPESQDIRTYESHSLSLINVKHFILKFYEDDVQWLCFEVWDDDEEEHELIGKTEL